METKTRAGWVTALVALTVFVAIALLAWLFAAALYPLFA